MINLSENKDTTVPTLLQPKSHIFKIVTLIIRAT